MRIRSVFILMLLVSSTPIHGLARDAGIAPALQNELLRMRAEEQNLRARWHSFMRREPGSPMPPEGMALLDQQEKNDRRNIARLEEIIQRHGWPGKSLVGEEAAEVAFLILLRAEPETLKKYFPLLEAAAKKGEARLDHAARMEDRILMEELKGPEVEDKPPVEK